MIVGLTGWRGGEGWRGVEILRFTLRGGYEHSAIVGAACALLLHIADICSTESNSQVSFLFFSSLYFVLQIFRCVASTFD